MTLFRMIVWCNLKITRKPTGLSDKIRHAIKLKEELATKRKSLNSYDHDSPGQHLQKSRDILSLTFTVKI